MNIRQKKIPVKGNSRSVQRQNWLTLSKHWCKVDTDDTTKHEDLNLVFATHGEEDEIYPLTRSSAKNNAEIT